jgi:hypothetical protein
MNFLIWYPHRSPWLIVRTIILLQSEEKKISHQNSKNLKDNTECWQGCETTRILTDCWSVNCYIHYGQLLSISSQAKHTSTLQPSSSLLGPLFSNKELTAVSYTGSSMTACLSFGIHFVLCSCYLILKFFFYLSFSGKVTSHSSGLRGHLLSLSRWNHLRCAAPPTRKITNARGQGPVSQSQWTAQHRRRINTCQVKESFTTK